MKFHFPEASASPWWCESSEFCKKFEICFLFAGRPLRMSLHDFSQVTGLNCSKIPKKNIRRKKNPIIEKQYWEELIAGRVHPMNSSSKVKFSLHMFFTMWLFLLFTYDQYDVRQR
ncbi:hypothetical protein BRARA_C03073 [Brassica rapa]|uniref:DUF1985 domain-containing protein n=1 Tax=Brassica campestris TaxID=3711 RepID=A0A398A7H0_BRACM|nr:hypothetical protein BRARA_C03073 [Brassica rapa]